MRIVVGYISICVIWGTTWLAIKFSIFTLPPFFSAGVRFAIASILIVIVLRVRHFKYESSPGQMLFLVLVGLGSFSVPYGLVYWAENRIPSGLTAVTFAVMPFFAAILSRIWLKTNDLTFWKVLGILLGFGGLVVIFGGDLSVGSVDRAEGIAAVVLSAMCNALVAVSVKRYGKNIDPIFINLIPMALGALTLLLTSYFVEDWRTLQFNASTVTAIIYLAAVGSVVAFGIYFYLLKHISVVLLSMTSFITPVLALASGAIFLGEQFPSGALVGTALILAGILTMNLAGEGKSIVDRETVVKRDVAAK